MRQKDISVLIIDDNQSFVQRMKGLLDELDYVETIHSAGNYDEALLQLDRQNHDMVLLDINLPGKNGIAILKQLRERNCKSKVIMISNYSEAYYREQCKKLGASHFLDKTSEFDQVPSLLSNIAINDPSMT